MSSRLFTNPTAVPGFLLSVMLTQPVAALHLVSGTPRPGPGLKPRPGGLHIATVISWTFPSLRSSWTRVLGGLDDGAFL